ncbi:MAG: hypothetical protein J6R00_05930, partial [Lentisphaeria bacterium]|nr:hypothetical protein [Lentisphaeria bacterium]
GNYVTDSNCYPWPFDVKRLPGMTSDKANFWSLLTGIGSDAKKYRNSYAPALKTGYLHGLGSVLGYRCPSHDGQHNGSGAYVSHYIVTGYSSWFIGRESFGMTGKIAEGLKTANTPAKIKAPSTKIMVFEFTNKNVNPMYPLFDGRYLYNGSQADYMCPVHNGRAGALFYDGHVSMVDVEGEFNGLDTNAAQIVWKKYVNTKDVF